MYIQRSFDYMPKHKKRKKKSNKIDHRQMLESFVEIGWSKRRSATNISLMSALIHTH